MGKSRKDKKGRVLREGEYYRDIDNRYVYSYLDPRGKRRYIYAKDLGKLRVKEEELRRDQLDGINSYVKGHVTINEAFDRCMKLKTNIRRTTRANYEMMYDAHVRVGFGEKTLGSVKYSDVLQFYKILVKEDGMSPTTVATINNCLYPAFELAVRDDVIRKNPCVGVLKELSKSIGKNKVAKKALTIEETKAFMNYMDGHPVYDHWVPIFTILLGTGCRCCEFIGLRWQDIDMETKVVDINHSLVRVKRHRNDPAQRLGVSEPKTDAGYRKIPMLDDVHDAFERIYAEQLITGFNETVIEGMSGFIFKNANGDVLCEQNINFAIRRIVESYNIDETLKAEKEKREPFLLPHFSCHILRHTFCTRLCENETNLKVIQSIMGHKNIKTTLEIYADATESKKQEVMQDFSAKWTIF